jgi:hypothetical protein
MAKVLSNTAEVVLGGYNLGLGGRNLRISAAFTPLETTDFDSSEVTNLLSIGRTEITYDGLWDGASGGNVQGLRVLLGGASAEEFALQMGTTEGDKAVIARVFTTGFETAPTQGELVPLGGVLATDGLPDYGRIALPKVTKSADYTGAVTDGINDGASSGSTAGFIWSYHVLSISGTWSVILQHSSSATGLGNLDSVTGITAIGAARRTSAAVMKRYTAIKLDETSSGSIVALAILRRL